MHPALTDLLRAVADDTRWGEALHGYAVSLGADEIGWFVLASGPEQLAQRGAEFATHPDPAYWLQSPSAEGGPALVGQGVTAEVTQRYAEHFRAQDPLWDAAMEGYAQAGPGGISVVTDPPRQARQRFRHAAFYEDFLRPHGIGTRMFGGARSARHPVGDLFASVYRLRDDDGFTREQVQRFQAEFGAVQQAAFLHREMLALRTRTQGLEGLMERLSMGMLFFDSGGRLLHANARARALAERREHRSLRRLLAGLPQMDASLRVLFAQSLRGDSGCIELPGGLLLVALALGDLAALGLGHPASGVAWVLMERTLDAAAAAALVRQAFRLSPAETALLLALLRGQTPQDFADARGVRIRTVRTQMSTLLLKTRTQRQQDLVALGARLMLLAPGDVPRAGAPPGGTNPFHA
ncbi:MAG: helix-turn-helix transcriptional regulator [Ottowia sp.]|uniref:helix-turn-helix transcriptional regulator n=1 Tax=unclassified Ottowia TaxID=2645081 RepID=UPI003C2EBFB8